MNLPPLAFFYNVQGGQLMIIILAILLLFGTKRLPGIARGLGKALKEFRAAASDIEQNLNAPTTQVVKSEPQPVSAEEKELPQPVEAASKEA